MNVIAEIKCDRCSKIDKRSLTLEEAQALGDREKVKEEKAQNLELELNQLLTENHPDIIIAIRDSEDSYTVKSINNLCIAGPEAKRNRGCKARVDTLISDIFMINKPAPKKVAPKKEAPTKPVSENKTIKDK